MTPYDFAQLALLAVGGEIKGKTKLQKTMYFLGVITDHLDDLGYRPHFYGPYSGEVANAVDCLASVGFVKESIHPSRTGDESGLEAYRHEFRLTPDGESVAQSKTTKDPEFWEKLQKAAKQLRRAPNLDYIKLSIAAKTYFMLQKKGGKASMGDLKKLAGRFGWDVSVDQVCRAAEYLKVLGLVTLAPSSSE